MSGQSLAHSGQSVADVGRFDRRIKLLESLGMAMTQLCQFCWLVGLLVVVVRSEFVCVEFGLSQLSAAHYVPRAVATANSTSTLRTWARSVAQAPKTIRFFL